MEKRQVSKGSSTQKLVFILKTVIEIFTDEKDVVIDLH
jgi:hypothetical protein